MNKFIKYSIIISPHLKCGKFYQQKNFEYNFIKNVTCRILENTKKTPFHKIGKEIQHVVFTRTPVEKLDCQKYASSTNKKRLEIHIFSSVLQKITKGKNRMSKD